MSLQYDWLPLGEVESETARWRELLHGHGEEGRDVLLAGRHVVLATDSASAPVIWDAAEDRMAAFFWKGGGWETFGMDFDVFMSALFFRPEQVAAGGMWIEALEQLAEVEPGATADRPRD